MGGSTYMWLILYVIRVILRNTGNTTVVTDILTALDRGPDITFGHV